MTSFYFNLLGIFYTKNNVGLTFPDRLRRIDKLSYGIDRQYIEHVYKLYGSVTATDL